MGLLGIMLEAAIAAQSLEVDLNIVLGIAALVVFFSVWALSRRTRRHLSGVSE